MLQDIDITLQDADEIRTFEAAMRKQKPWLFDAIAE